MSNNKQSSIEWFLDELIKEGYIKRLPVTQFQQAKLMHKQEIKNAFTNGFISSKSSNRIADETFYNEIFGGNNESSRIK